MLLAKQTRRHVTCPGDIAESRWTQIGILEQATGNNQYAGVLRYELAQLNDLVGRHMEALRLHAANREQHPRFYRGRYRLCMSLEMIANPAFELREPGKTDENQPVRDELARDKLNEILTILNRCGVTKNVKCCDGDIADGKLTPGLQEELLKAAAKELRAIRRELALWHVVWVTFRYRNERAIYIPHWRLRKRQSFHDGVCAAELLVAIRRSLNEEGPSGISWKPHMIQARRIVAGIARDKVPMRKHLRNRKAQGTPESQDRKLPSAEKRDRTRWLPWQHRTPSWEAAYNAACAYAALGLDHQVVNSLWRAINNRDCEMQRPSDWIACDPDFNRVQSSTEFESFLEAQIKEDYPPVLKCPVRVNREELAAGAGVSQGSSESAPAGNAAGKASLERV
jgi:hypothetical protein